MDEQLRRPHDAAVRSRDATATRVRRATVAAGVAATLGATGLGLMVASTPATSALAATATHRTTTSSTTAAPSSTSATSSSTTPTTTPTATTPVTVSGQS